MQVSCRNIVATIGESARAMCVIWVTNRHRLTRVSYFANKLFKVSGPVISVQASSRLRDTNRPRPSNVTICDKLRISLCFLIDSRIPAVAHREFA